MKYKKYHPVGTVQQYMTDHFPDLGTGTLLKYNIEKDNCLLAFSCINFIFN
jgi:hypothetical protein